MRTELTVRDHDRPERRPRVAAKDARRPSAQGVSGARRAIFTIVSCNYIGFAATLMQSVREHHPESDRYIILSDAIRDFPDVDLAAKLICCDDIAIRNVDNMKLWYSVIEFNTAVKPFAFTHFLEREHYDQALYIDPDILLYKPLSHVVEALEVHDCVLTPHMMVPLQDGKEPSDHTIMKSGVYNLGFLGLKNSADGRHLARWWSDRCYAHCRVDIAGNLFTDQRWMDMAPVLVGRPKILRHPGYNIAYWNLPHREVSQAKGGAWKVNGLPLHFFHFSGIKPDDFEQFSKHQNRFTIENMGPARDLCTDYRQRVLANHWADYAKTPYAFGSFPDGRRIEDAMRRSIIRAIDDERIDRDKLIERDGAYFDDVEEEALERGARLTRFMYQFWLDRRDLRAAFDIFTEQGLATYFQWFTNGEAAKQGVDDASIRAAMAMKGGERTPQSRPALRLPPWPSVARDAWQGPARDIAQWLRRDIMIDIGGEQRSIPRMLALCWEQRLDLQTHFPCDNLDSYNGLLSWAVTSGFREQCLHEDWLPDNFTERFTALSAISDQYGDVPITEGMFQTRTVDIARSFLRAYDQFPIERTGRLAHGLWFAFCAPAALKWPARYCEAVRRWFMQRTEISCDGYRLTRGAISIWELRPDLQDSFRLSDEQSVRLYLRWLVINGLGELGVAIADFDPMLQDFLMSDSPRCPGVSILAEMIYERSPELRKSFSLTDDAGRAGVRRWAEKNLVKAVANTPASRMLEALATKGLAPTEQVLRPRLVLTGQWSAPSGRGEDVRGSAAALLAVGDDDFLIVDIAKGQLLRPDGTAVDGPCRVETQVNIVHMNADTAVRDAILLHRLKVQADRLIGFWAWELERLPSYWRHAYGCYDEIWSATEFADEAFRAEQLRPVQLVPMVVRAPEIGTFLSRAALGLSEDETVFLFVFDYRSFASRKNPEAVITAFAQAFPAGDEKVRLIIKTQGADARPEAAAALQRLAADPRIELRDRLMERNELLNLIKRSDAFVSLHRSEGFGRGPAEAMLLAVPTIATDYSGTADFATAGAALPVRFDMVKVDPGEYPGVEGQSWADADIDHAAEQMVWVHKHPSLAEYLGEAGRERIVALYSPSVVGCAMHAALFGTERPPARATA